MSLIGPSNIPVFITKKFLYETVLRSVHFWWSLYRECNAVYLMAKLENSYGKLYEEPTPMGVNIVIVGV